jgi:phage terminase large subunit GpA-like protein
MASKRERIIRGVLDRLESYGDDPTLQQCYQDLGSLLVRRTGKPKPSKVAKEKQPAKPSRRERMAEIRAAVFARAGGTCEACGSRVATECHHVLSGPGRRFWEAVDTCVALCGHCHRLVHRNDRWALERVSQVGGLAFRAVVAVERRLDKLRAQHPERAP